MKTGEGPCGGVGNGSGRAHLRLIRGNGADANSAPAPVVLFTCASCDEIYPIGAAMDGGRKGNFLVDTCPDCYVEILATEGIVPNAAEAQRIEDCRSVIAALQARRPPS